MRNILNGFIILVILSTLNSCSIFIKKAKYDKEDLEFYNVYKEKDTLIFQSISTQKKDTSIVISKRIYTDKDWYRNINQEIRDLRYTNKIFKNSLYYNNSSNLFTNDKIRDSINHKFVCSYLRSNFLIDDKSVIKELKTLTLSQKAFNNVYELVYKRPKFHGGKDDDPEILYWDKKYGIIKYITFKGEIWERINWN